MAKNIKLTSGSIFNGNPITISVEPMVVSGTDKDGNTIYPSFHRIIVEVKCGMNLNGEGSYETITMSQPVETEKEGNQVSIDISSALRTLRDSYEYTPNATTYPFVSFNVKVYDEYMLNGEVKTNMGIQYYPAETQYLRTIFGAFSDFVRLSSVNGTCNVQELSTKPKSAPHLAVIGEVFAYTPSYDAEQVLLSSGSLSAPSSQEVQITDKGLQSIGGQSIYAIPASSVGQRVVFRFINSRGVLESISVPNTYSKKMTSQNTSYAVSVQETFNRFSRSVVNKKNDRQLWLFVSDPLNEDWQEWYLHEFMMSEHIWMNHLDVWIPVTITPEDDMVMFDKTNTNLLSVAFTAQLDINGSPNL